MKRFILFLLLLATGAKAQKHVVLISIDGLRPELYLDKSWPAPIIQKLAREGVHAYRMKSVFPSYTYPAHTAMITGAFPARSGIIFNTKIGSPDWYWYSKDIKVPTLWQVLKKSNLTSAAIHWPVTAGQTTENGIDYNFPEIWEEKHVNDRITVGKTYAPKGLLEEIEKNATGKLDSTTMDAGTGTMGENVARMACYLFETRKPALLAVHFIDADHQQHVHGRDHEAVKLAVASIDYYIGRIVEAVERSGEKDNTTVIIVGDHGFSDYNQILRPNIWIKDWKLDSRARFQPSGGSAFLYLEDKSDEKDKQQTAAEIRKRLSELPKRYKSLFRVIERRELDELGADDNAVLALASEPGTVFGGAKEGEVLAAATPGGHHGFDPRMPEMYTGFIAAGAHVKKGESIEEIRVTDIAPLIARLLNVEFKAPDCSPDPFLESILEWEK